MATRAPAMHRRLATSAAASTVTRKPGMRVSHAPTTATGGSGLDSTALSASMDEASAKARATYRTALRDIPTMQRNFTIMESRALVGEVIRECFERHRDVTDPKVVDMLVFKAEQELREIREQWKSRHHVYGYIQRFTEKKLREELAARARDAGPDQKRHEEILQIWRSRGLVPDEIKTWPMFQKWNADEDVKFRAFALENKLFSEEQLDRAKNRSSGCAVM